MGDFAARHDIPVRVEILDTETGERKWTDSDWSSFGTYWWAEGNGSCDCNRSMAFGHESPEDCVHQRYRIVGVEPLLKGYTLDDFNQGYPDT